MVWSKRDDDTASHLSADELNKYFVTIATDPSFDKQVFLANLQSFLTQQQHDIHFDWSEYFICVALTKTKHTAAGFSNYLHVRLVPFCVN